MIRFTQFAATLAGSWLAGLVGAFLVWNFIYSIGDRVIADEIYEQLQNTVVKWGGISGAVAAVWMFAWVPRTGPVVLLIGHPFVTIAGFIGGMTGWQNGLYSYFGSWAPFMIYAVLKAPWCRRVIPVAI